MPSIPEPNALRPSTEPSMTAPSFLASSSRVARMALLAVWLLGTAGCAQMRFPELPAGLFEPPAAAPAEQTDAGAPADGDAVAASVDPSEADLPGEADDDTEPGKLFDWTGDGRKLTRIVIDTNEQTAHFYADDERVGWTTIASGVASHPTPRGQFSILEKVRDKRSNLYGKIVGRNGRVIRASAHGRDPVPPGARFVGASMPNFMRLTYDGIGMHAGPIPRPGQPASHGCIRMPPVMAASVYEHVGPGTAVTVIGDGPDYGNYAERIAQQQAEERARRAAAAAATQGTALDALDAEIEVLEAAAMDTSAEADSSEALPMGSESSDSAAAAPAAGATSDDAHADAGATVVQPAGAGEEQPTTPQPTPSASPEAAPGEPSTPVEPQLYGPPAAAPRVRSASLPPDPVRGV